MASLKLLHNLVAVDIDPVEETSEGGLILTAAVEAAKRTGTVVYVGPGMYNEKGKFVETAVQPGDRIAFSENAKTEEVKLDGKTLNIIAEAEIFGVICE